jgi:hypothetical protein
VGKNQRDNYNRPWPGLTPPLGVSIGHAGAAIP